MRLIALALLLVSSNLLAQENDIKHINLQDDVAIQGYDPVAYFTKNKAVEGKKEFQYQHMEVPYRFSNLDNLESFKKNPEMYEPAYGGWCAYAMGVDGSKVKVDPETFKIVDGKLNLFYNFFFNNTLKDWNKDEDNLKSQANENWSKIINK